MPGYLFMRVWRLLVPSKDFKLKDHIPEVIVISVIHFALFRLLASQIDKPVTWWILLILFLVPIPVTLAIALKKFRNSKLMQGRILHPVPRAWDYFFGMGKPCFMLIHLKNGDSIGGLYGWKSFASSFPEAEDIYLEEIWEMDERGIFLEKLDGSTGALVNSSNIEYIELYECTDMEGVNK